MVEFSSLLGQTAGTRSSHIRVLQVLTQLTWSQIYQALFKMILAFLPFTAGYPKSHPFLIKREN